jgi:sulfite reductase (NADPH) flavoprotein alpha-component
MLNEKQLVGLKNLIAELSKGQLAWASGYLASLAGESQVNDSLPAINIIYGTETGTSKNIALELATKARAAGFKAKQQDAAAYRLANIVKEKHLYIIMATHGEGEPPANSLELFAHIETLKPDSLKGLTYSVLALGDSSYPLYCKAGVDLDQKLATLGAKRLVDVALADVDFEEIAEKWQNEVLQALASSQNVAIANVTPAKKSSKGYNRKNPLKGQIIANVNLNDKGSNKETHHIELALEDGLTYEAGDALGVLLIGENKDLTPRLYSIASSQNSFDGEAHLTVGVVRYEENGVQKEGICSSYLASLKEGDEIDLYIHRNSQFRLPAEDKPIIMVGSGTGIAPFRGFLQEREASGASGKNWLFFGEQHAQSDFFYQIEWQDYLKGGLLTKMTVAFSRDQKDKVYVQDRVAQNAKEIYQWLEEGASFYICGGEAMGNSVKEALLAAIKVEGRKSSEETDAYFKALIADDRFKTDLYD